MAKSGEKLIVDNRRARHDYHLLERVEAGLVLTGTEVKSHRDGRASLQQAYADVRDGEAWLETELLDRHAFHSRDQARLAVFTFIEGFYNPRRRHSALGQCSPDR